MAVVVHAYVFFFHGPPRPATKYSADAWRLGGPPLCGRARLGEDDAVRVFGARLEAWARRRREITCERCAAIGDDLLEQGPRARHVAAYAEWEARGRGPSSQRGGAVFRPGSRSSVNKSGSGAGGQN